MKITKITTKGGSVTIRASDQDDLGHARRDMTITSDAEPRPELARAFSRVKVAALKEIGAPPLWADAVCTGASFSHDEDDGRLGIVATLQVPLPGFTSPLVVNSPHKKEPADGSNEPGLTGEFLFAAQDLLGEALLYAKGQRAQLDLEDILSRPVTDDA